MVPNMSIRRPSKIRRHSLPPGLPRVVPGLRRCRRDRPYRICTSLRASGRPPRACLGSERTRIKPVWSALCTANRGLRPILLTRRYDGFSRERSYFRLRPVNRKRPCTVGWIRSRAWRSVRRRTTPRSRCRRQQWLSRHETAQRLPGAVFWRSRTRISSLSPKRTPWMRN